MRKDLALIGVLAALAAPTAAGAATTVGSTLAGPADASACPAADCTAFTGDGSSNAPVATAPSDGVIVRWRVRAGGDYPGVALNVLRASGPGMYASIGTSDTVGVVAAGTGVNTFLTRIPVKAGDVIGLDAPKKALVFTSGVPTAAEVMSQLGAPQTPTSVPGRELLVNADVEADVDGDGYGDETQDQCPIDPARHTECVANLTVAMQPAPAPLTVGRPLTFTIKVSNTGLIPAQDAGVVVTLPPFATPLQVRAGRGSCAGAAIVTCHLGAIASGSSATVLLTVRPEVPGTLVATATTSTSTPETSTDDNAFTSDVTVLPPTLRMLSLRLTHSVIAVGGSTAIRWFMTDAATVTVKVEQITRKGRIRPVGSFPVARRAGSDTISFKGRIPRHRPLKPGNYRFTVSAATLDGRVTAPAHLSFGVRRGRHS